MGRVSWQYCNKCERPTNHTEECGCLNCAKQEMALLQNGEPKTLLPTQQETPAGEADKQSDRPASQPASVA